MYSEADNQNSAPDISPALEQFTQLLDEGLTRAKLKRFLDECAERGPDYLYHVKRCLRTYRLSGKMIRESM